MSSQKNGSGISDSDNEMAGRLILMGVLSIIAVIVLAVSPILISGFLIGLTWYGAYVEDGEPNGERLLWPVVITGLLFIYLLGFPPPFEQTYQGLMFTDLGRWTLDHAVVVIKSFNELLPKKFMIRSVSFHQMRIYGWLIMMAAIASFVYLHFKAAGRGVFLYRAVNQLFMPFRVLSNYLAYVYAALSALIFALIYRHCSWSIVFGLTDVLLLMTIYRLTSGEADKKIKLDSAIEAKNVTLGHEKGRPNKKLMLSKDELNHHVHIVGASGFGKSVLLSHMIRSRIQSGDGLLFIDLKADFETIRQVVSVAKATGRLEDLKIFSCGNPEFSNPYNVIKNGTANQLKDRIMGAMNWSEEFYKNEAQSFLLKLLRGLCALRDHHSQDFDLSNILKCLNDPKSILDIADGLPQSQEGLKRELQELMSHVSRPDNLKALQGLKSQIESLILSDFGHLLKSSKDGIDLFEAIQNKKIVFVLLDSRSYGESSRSLGKLILQDLKAASAKIDNETERHSRTSFGVIVDEFADMASEDFIGFLDRARSSKMGVVVAHQEIADLSRVSPEFTRRLMNSTSTLFSFLQKLPDSSELIAGIAGTKKSQEVTEQAKANWLFGDEKTGMKSIKTVDEFNIHPNVVRSLGVGECVVVHKYPKSRSGVFKIKPESNDNYMSELEVKNALYSLQPYVEILKHELKQVSAPKIPPPRSSSSLKTNTEAKPNESNYWG